MAVEGPTLTAIVARLDNATFNLAAYGLAFAFAMLVESPIVNLLSASVALAKDRAAAAKLQRFMIWLNIAITVVMILLCIPAVFKLLATDAIGLADDIAWRFHVGLMILTPWPAAIGYRRFYQGLLIRNNQTRKVANGTIVRLVSMATSASILALATNAEGIIVATVGLTTGVVCEALATRWMARGVIKLYRDQELDDCEPPPTDREIIRFYTPLALTSAVGFLSMPILSYFMNQAPQAVASPSSSSSAALDSLFKK
jgi:progressive ankylosis protein